MNSYYELIPGLIKYVAIIDRDNSPILFLNLSDQEKELEYQLIVYSSLDLLEFKEQQKLSRNVQEEYVGLLMPCYEYEYDTGIYGFVGNNGIKITTIKKIENSIQETSSEIKLKSLCKEIYSKLIKLFLNPFYDKKEFFIEESQVREKFADSIKNLIKNYQII